MSTAAIIVVLAVFALLIDAGEILIAIGIALAVAIGVFAVYLLMSVV